MSVKFLYKVGDFGEGGCLAVQGCADGANTGIVLLI